LNKNKVKVCTKCGQEKSLSEFHKDKYSNDGYTSNCKECRNKRSHKWRKTKIGLIKNIYKHEKECSIKRGHSLPKYTYEELEVWVLSQPNFNDLYDKWVKSNYDRMLSPSINRLDNNKGYSFDNIELVSWEVNHYKQGEEIIEKGANRCVPLLEFDLEGNLIQEYFSISTACRKYNVSEASINVLNKTILGEAQVKKRKHIKHKIFVYKKDFDIERLHKHLNYVWEDGVLQFDLEGNYINKFLIPKYAIQSLGKTNYSTISQCANKRIMTAYGFIWIKIKDYSKKELYERLDKVKQNLRNN